MIVNYPFYNYWLYPSHLFFLGWRWNEQFHGVQSDNKNEPALFPQGLFHSRQKVSQQSVLWPFCLFPPCFLRYSDFLGLHEKLVARYQGRGRIIPPAPEKSLLGTTRVKMGGGEVVEEGAGHTKAHFISLRRAALERFINRVALHPVLRYTFLLF